MIDLIIYKVTNKLNGKIYIGQTINTLEFRKDQHFRDTRCMKKKTTYFHNAIKKYGAENFVFEEIDSANNLEELNQKERYWIKFYSSNNKEFGYNLDSGGKNGGEKSIETKRKIGDTTLIKWKNPEIACKMREGLKKGTETQKSKPKKVKIVYCEYCGKKMIIPAYEEKRRKYCSNQCVADAGRWKNGVKSASQKVHTQNIERKEIIKEDIEKWVFENQEIVKNCPKNKIRSTLVDLIGMTKDRYDLKDFRSLFGCFDDVHNMKEFLYKLQEIIPEENVC